MGTHPIDELMKTAMESIRDMVDVNTIVGDAVQTADDTVIIPVSRVTFGFAAGGGDYQGQNDSKSDSDNNGFPFAGGSGAGVKIHPVAFLVVGKNNTIKLLPVEHNTTIDRFMDFISSMLDKIVPVIMNKKEEEEKNKNKKEEKSSRNLFKFLLLYVGYGLGRCKSALWPHSGNYRSVTGTYIVAAKNVILYCCLLLTSY
uniref:GerW family sporulation protein n=1 Tax=Thermoclostridium stercorarium TaxID=1510 RepID=UPI00396A1291